MGLLIKDNIFCQSNCFDKSSVHALCSCVRCIVGFDQRSISMSEIDMSASDSDLVPSSFRSVNMSVF